MSDRFPDAPALPRTLIPEDAGAKIAILLVTAAVIVALHLTPPLSYALLWRSPWMQLAARLLEFYLVVNAAALLWRLALVWRSPRLAAASDAQLPMLTVVVPAFNEGQPVLETLRGILASDYPPERLQVIAVDDGSADDTRAWLQQAAALAAGRIELICFDHNRGKRHAMYTAFRRSRGEVLVTVDSDTVIEPDTLRQLATPFVGDARVGAVAGNVRVLNRREGLIPRMLEITFCFTFNFVRQSQSRVKAVQCVPGALAGYRRSAAMPVLKQWLQQHFLGCRCYSGEDRALTNLILRAGYFTVFQPAALVYTRVPTTYGGLCRMLLRWARSNVRETVVMAGFVWRRFRPGFALGLRINFVLTTLNLAGAPLLAIATLAAVIQLPACGLAHLFAGALAAGCIQGGHYALARRSSDALWALPACLFAVVALSWIPLVALLTPHRSGWLTRRLPTVVAAKIR